MIELKKKITKMGRSNHGMIILDPKSIADNHLEFDKEYIIFIVDDIVINEPPMPPVKTESGVVPITQPEVSEPLTPTMVVPSINTPPIETSVISTAKDSASPSVWKWLFGGSKKNPKPLTIKPLIIRDSKNLEEFYLRQQYEELGK